MIATQCLFRLNPIFYKSDRLELVERGRWGPRWLHRLIFRAAKNCGMIRHGITEGVSVHRKSLPHDKFKALHQTILHYLDRGFHRDTDLVIYCGPENWHDVASTEYFRSTLSFGYGIAGARHLMGIPVFIVPEMEGMIVVPHPAKFGVHA